MLRTHRAGKGPVGCGGVELRLKEQKGPRRAPHPWSQRAADLTWEPSRLPGLKWVGQTPSSPPPVWEGPSHLPLLISSASLLYLQGPTWPGGDFEGRALAWELIRLPRSEWAGQLPSTPLPLFPESPSRLPLLISLASGAPILSDLHFSSRLSPHYVLPIHSGVPPVSLGIRVSHQWPAVTLVVGRC